MSWSRTPGAERPADEPCPPMHTKYLSQLLAENAAYLHTVVSPHCLTITAFPHGDHFHIGHSDEESGKACKATQGERASWRSKVAASRRAGNPKGKRRG